MSQNELNENDFLKIIIAGGIGVFTLSYYLIQMWCKCNCKKKFKIRANKEEEKIALKKNDSKSEKISNDINNEIINIEEKKEVRNENNKKIKMKEKNINFDGDDKKKRN